MFTGIITAVGTVAELAGGAEAARLRIGVPTPFFGECRIGDSVAVDGCCLTVVDIAAGGQEAGFELGPVTMERIAPINNGGLVNLEHSLRVGDSLGGHFVYGHVDGQATLAQWRPQAGGVEALFEIPADVDPRLVTVRGSVAIAGVSLTVASVAGPAFAVQLIPHTLAATRFGQGPAPVPGEKFNFEADSLARIALGIC